MNIRNLTTRPAIGEIDGKLNTSKWAKIKVSTDTALPDIQNLEEQGVLVKESGGGRSTSYKLGELGLSFSTNQNPPSA